MKKLYTFKEFLSEKAQVNNWDNFVFEGGAAGQMLHQFNDH